MTKQEYEETLKSILPGLPQTNFPVAFEYKTVNQKEVANIRLGDVWFEYDYLDGDADDFKLRFLTTFYWAIAPGCSLRAAQIVSSDEALDGMENQL